MKITLDTDHLSEHAIEKLAQVFDAKAAELWHLSAGVPEEHAPALERGAEKEEAKSEELRALIRDRNLKRKIRADAIFVRRRLSTALVLRRSTVDEVSHLVTF